MCHAGFEGKLKLPHVGKMWRTFQTETVVYSGRYVCEPAPRGSEQRQDRMRFELKEISLWPQKQRGVQQGSQGAR